MLDVPGSGHFLFKGRASPARSFGGVSRCEVVILGEADEGLIQLKELLYSLNEIEEGERYAAMLEGQ